MYVNLTEDDLIVLHSLFKIKLERLEKEKPTSGVMIGMFIQEQKQCEYFLDKFKKALEILEGYKAESNYWSGQ